MVPDYLHYRDIIFHCDLPNRIRKLAQFAQVPFPDFPTIHPSSTSRYFKNLHYYEHSQGCIALYNPERSGCLSFRNHRVQNRNPKTLFFRPRKPNPSDRHFLLLFLKSFAFSGKTLLARKLVPSSIPTSQSCGLLLSPSIFSTRPFFTLSQPSPAHHHLTSHILITIYSGLNTITSL